jgi:two-component system, OmpR family, response regulator ChvI
MDMSTDVDVANASANTSIAGEAAIRVVAVDDDEYFREMLSNELTEHGFSVMCYPDGPSLLETPDALAECDVIVLDWHLPHTPGIELLAQLKRRGIAIPVVFLTGRALTANETLAFDRGALDFVDKARGMATLVRRLRVAVRAKTTEPQREQVLHCGHLVLKPPMSRAYWNEMDLDLTVGEFKIVHLLARNAGSHVSYRDIYDSLHYRGFIAGNGDDGYKANVRSAIKRIRNKFRMHDESFVEIENYTAFGYVWRRGCGSGPAS